MFKMLCFKYIIFIWCGMTIAERSVTFPDDSPTNGTVTQRFGWPIFGKYLSGLDTILGGDVNVPIQTMTMPTTTADRSPAPPTFTPVLPAHSMTFPPPPSLPAGIVIPDEPPSAATEPDSTIIEPIKCECMPVELCRNQTTRNDGTTRIVTRPPPGTNCEFGEVYCCIENTKLGCGIPNIVPGVYPGEGQADLGEYPWSAIILTNDNIYIGGGVLIDATRVLTAAHKVAKYGNGAGLKIRLGEWDLSNEEEPVNYLEVKISKIVNHPKFEANTLKNDISLITLASPVATFTRPFPQINTICLPESTAVFTGSRCKVAGWGKDRFDGQYQNIIKEVEVPVLSNNDCQDKLRKTRLGSSFVLDTNSFICAGGEFSRDACTGDGGTALACLQNGQYYLAGITAGGIECGNENVPGLYVNVVNYLTWVQAQINGGNGNNGGIDPRSKKT